MGSLKDEKLAVQQQSKRINIHACRDICSSLANSEHTGRFKGGPEKVTEPVSPCIRGKFGQVFKLTHKESGRVCAGKFYKGRRAKEREAARKEIELMNYLHHPKLVQCLAAYDQSPEMVMVMEL